MSQDYDDAVPDLTGGLTSLLADVRHGLADKREDEEMSRAERIAALDYQLARLREKFMAAQGNNRRRTEIFREMARAKFDRRRLAEEPPCES